MTIKTIVAHTYNTIKNRLRPIFSSNGERFTNHIADTTYSSQPFHKFKLFELMLSVLSFDSDTQPRYSRCKFFARPGPIKKIYTPIRSSLGTLGRTRFCFVASISKNYCNRVSVTRISKNTLYTTSHASSCYMPVNVYPCLRVRVCRVWNGSQARSPRMMRNERNHKCPLSASCDTVAGTQASHDIARRYL